MSSYVHPSYVRLCNCSRTRVVYCLCFFLCSEPLVSSPNQRVIVGPTRSWIKIFIENPWPTVALHRNRDVTRTDLWGECWLGWDLQNHDQCWRVGWEKENLNRIGSFCKDMVVIFGPLFPNLILWCFWTMVYIKGASFQLLAWRCHTHNSSQNIESDTAPLDCDYGACFNRSRKKNASSLNWIYLEPIRAT